MAYDGRKVYFDETNPLDVDIVNTDPIDVNTTTSSGLTMSTVRGDDVSSGSEKELLAADADRTYLMLFVEDNGLASDTDFYLYIGDGTTHPIRIQPGVMWEPKIVPTNVISYYPVDDSGTATGAVIAWYA